MLVFHSPVWLWCLPAVAAAAAWALYRPQRRLAIVGSLELWQEAVEHLDRSQRMRARRITLSWLLLLAGALAATLAAARPAFLSSAPARSIAIAVYPSAEVARKEGMAGLRHAAEELLARLAPRDRVQLLLPDQPGAARWLSVEEAHGLVRSLLPVPVPAAEISLPSSDAAAQHLYCIAPAGAAIPPVAGPSAKLATSGSAGLATSETLIEVQTALPDVTLDALAAQPLPDGNIEVFLALQNHLPLEWKGYWKITTLDANEDEGVSLILPFGPQARSSFIRIAPPGRALEFELRPGQVGDGNGHAPGPAEPWGGFLVRRESAAVKVALVGDDDPLIRRFIAVDPELSLVENAAGADVLVCIGFYPPTGADAPGAGKPALVIRPPSPPPGTRDAGRLENVVLGDAGMAADSQDPVMRNVNLSAVALRSAAPWSLDRDADLKTLCAVRGQALIVRTTPELQAAEAGGARRIYVAFGTDTENTNFATTDSFVIFLANAFHWLTPSGGVSRPAAAASRPAATQPATPARYEFVSPRGAAFSADWQRIAPAASPEEIAWAKGPHPPPGLYRDGQGNLHAVSLVGLHGGRPQTPPAQAVAAAPLPPPQPTGTAVELWTWLALAALALWLGGWAARMR